MTEETFEFEGIIEGKVVGCDRLNVRKEPSASSEVVKVINRDEEVMLDEMESTDEFYRVCTQDGSEGYCMRKYIEVQE